MAIDYFTEAELRALPQMSDDSVYSTARVEAAAAYVTGVIERVVGTSFVARTVTAEVHDGDTYGVLLNKPYAASVTSATENGVAVTDPLSVRSGVVHKYAAGSYSPGYWASGCRNITVTYEAGYSSTPPADVKEAAIRATRLHLLATNSNAAVMGRQTSVTNEAGTFTFPVASADRPFGHPEIDSVILGWRAKLNVLGFA